jgi:pilus assembly protein CpaE
MADNLTVLLSADDQQQRREITAALAGIDGLDTAPDFGDRAGEPPVEADLHILGEALERGDLIERIRLARERMPQTPLLVVSSDYRPEHVVEVMQAGANHFVTTPLGPAKLKEAVERVRQSILGPSAQPNGKVYSFISSKGGLGATVLSVNAAVSLTQAVKGKVLLLDNCLYQGDTSVLLDVVPERTIAHLSRNFHRLDRVYLEGTVVEHQSGLHLLAAPCEPDEGEFVESEHMTRIIQLARTIYAHTVVDCGSMSLGPTTRAALEVSERIFVVTDLSVPAVRNTDRLISRMRRLDIDPHKIEVVVNRFSRGTVLSVNEVEKTLRRRLFWLFPNEFDSIVSSINEGVPLVEKQSGCNFSRSVGQFTEKLMGRATKESFRGAKGLFGKVI